MSFETHRGYPNREARRQGDRAGRRAAAMLIAAATVGLCWFAVLARLAFGAMSWWLERS